MKNSELKKLLKEEAESHVPDLRAKLGILYDSPEKTPEKKSAVKRKRVFARSAAVFLSAAACIALIVGISLGMPRAIPSAEMNAVICLRINPSVELTAEEGKIKTVRALNTDAIILLKNLTLVGLADDEACLVVADAAKRSGFITDKGIEIVVAGKDDQALRGKISQKLSPLYHVNIDSPSAKIKEDAKKYKVSEGKMQLVHKILAATDAYKIQKLVKMDTDDLLDILEDYDEARMEDFEDKIQREYAAQYQEFAEKAKTLLESYAADLKQIIDDVESGAQVGRINASIRKLNDKYKLLGEDFEIEEFESEDEPEPDELQEYLDEAMEAIRGGDDALEEIADDLFEQWLDDFKESMKEKRH